MARLEFLLVEAARYFHFAGFGWRKTLIASADLSVIPPNYCMQSSFLMIVSLRLLRLSPLSGMASSIVCVFRFEFGFSLSAENLLPGVFGLVFIISVDVRSFWYFFSAAIFCRLQLEMLHRDVPGLFVG